MHREKLFCITKYCYAACKIVLYHEKSLCIQLNIEFFFALVGHRTKSITVRVPYGTTKAYNQLFFLHEILSAG